MNIMIDLETMGQTPSAPITAIGACEVCPLPETFYRVIHLGSAVDTGAIMDADTVLWWLKQPDEARDEFRHGGEELAEALLSLTNWLQALCPDINQRILWAKGTSFDFAILSESYRRCRMAKPWHYWNERDLRTIKALHQNLTAPETGTKHNAIDDARNQAEHLWNLLQRQWNLETRA